MASPLSVQASIALKLAHREKKSIALIVAGKWVAFEHVRSVEVDEACSVAIVRGAVSEPHPTGLGFRSLNVRLDLGSVSAILERDAEPDSPTPNRGGW